MSWLSLCGSELTHLPCDGKIVKEVPVSHRTVGLHCWPQEEAITFSNPLKIFMTQYSDFYAGGRPPQGVSETLSAVASNAPCKRSMFSHAVRLTLIDRF